MAQGWPALVSSAGRQPQCALLRCDTERWRPSSAHRLRAASLGPRQPSRLTGRQRAVRAANLFEVLLRLVPHVLRLQGGGGAQ